MNNKPTVGSQSPWGTIDFVNNVAPGIMFVSTPSHGGYWLDSIALNLMPQDLRCMGTFTGDAHWFEEDCDWAMVALSFPAFFPPEAREEAIAMVKWLKSLRLPDYARTRLQAKVREYYGNEPEDNL